MRLTKKLAQELMKVGGDTRGFNLKHDGDYVLKEKGEKGLSMVEKELEALGYPLQYRDIKEMDFYPAGMRALSLLAIQKVFGLGEEAGREICSFHPKISLVVKLFMKYFYSLDRMLEAAQRLWRKYWTVGELEVGAYSQKEKFVILKIKNFNLHPSFCRCLEGYFSTLAAMVVKSNKVLCRETKCSFAGKNYHEFLVTWK